MTEHRTEYRGEILTIFGGNEELKICSGQVDMYAIQRDLFVLNEVHD